MDIFVEQTNNVEKMSTYQEFINGKVVKAEKYGFEVKPENIHPSLYHHQRDTVIWAFTATPSPFGGIASVPYMAVKMGRYGMATELNTDYWKDGTHYLKAIETKINTPTLFDLVTA